MFAPFRPITTPSSTSQSIFSLTRGSITMSSNGPVTEVWALVKTVGGLTCSPQARALSAACFS